MGFRNSQLSQPRQDSSEVRIVLDPLDEIVLSSLLLDDSSSLVGKDSDLLVSLLSVSSGLDDGHDDVLGGPEVTNQSEKSERVEGEGEGEGEEEDEHERKLLGDSSSDDLGVDDETLEDVLEGAEDDIGGEESLGEGDSSVGAASKKERREVRFETRRGKRETGRK